MKSLVKKLFSLCIFLIIFSVYTQAQAPILPLPLCYQKPHYKQTCDILQIQLLIGSYILTDLSNIALTSEAMVSQTENSLISWIASL